MVDEITLDFILLAASLFIGLVLVFGVFEWDQAHPLDYKAAKETWLSEWIKRNFGIGLAK
ncbi:MAG: hypothetical protein WED05_07915 [Candidatus Atabeyarchaeum deiterrae]|jgi:hypothetical protein